MLGPSPMHIKYSSYVYDGFCIWRTNFPGPIESVISKFTCIPHWIESMINENKSLCNLIFYLIIFLTLYGGLFWWMMLFITAGQESYARNNSVKYRLLLPLTHLYWTSRYLGVVGHGSPKIVLLVGKLQKLFPSHLRHADNNNNQQTHRYFTPCSRSLWQPAHPGGRWLGASDRSVRITIWAGHGIIIISRVRQHSAMGINQFTSGAEHCLMHSKFLDISKKAIF